VQRQPEIIDEHSCNILVQYREINSIFRNSPIEGSTAKERTLYVNEATIRISKWVSELRSYGLRYEPRTTIKGQILADFIADFTLRATEHADQLKR